MELKEKVAVITRGTSEISLALAVRFMKQGALVILSDLAEKGLFQKAAEAGAFAIAADPAQKSDIKKLIDKTTQWFGKIDLFVSTISFAEIGEHYLSEKDWNLSCQADALSQMYVAKYILPQMINRGSGYLLNMVPGEKLLAEFRSGMYSTLKHPSLSFAERMAATYNHLGIKVSVLCSDDLLTIKSAGNKKDDQEIITPQTLANSVVKGIQLEEFMITSSLKKTMNYMQKSQRIELTKAMRA